MKSAMADKHADGQFDKSPIVGKVRTRNETVLGARASQNSLEKNKSSVSLHKSKVSQRDSESVNKSSSGKLLPLNSMKLRQMHNLLKDDVKMQIEEAIREMKEKEE